MSAGQFFFLTITLPGLETIESESQTQLTNYPGY